MVRNILALIIGLVVGMGVNMSLIMLGSSLVPAPLGVDVTDAQSLSASVHLLEPKDFVVPFLAHALGTLSGALTAFVIAASYRSAFAHAIGAVSLAGGVAAAFMIPAPAWFIIVDLLIAYVPMAWVATRVGRRLRMGAVSPP